MRTWLVFLVFVFSSTVCAGDLTWQSVEAKIAAKFPSAKVITVKALNARLKNKESVVLIDVREKKEFQVSHLPDAVHETRADAIVRSYKTFAGMVVVYCSVGYRSADMAVQLTAAGMKRVFNLKGSIFAWANEGYPLVDKQGMTRFVHPYNRHWGQLLQKKYHAYK